MSQELRNKIYAVAGSIFGLGVVLGWFTTEESTDLLLLVENSLNIVGSVGVLINSFLAWWNSRTNRVTTVAVPKESLTSVDVTQPSPRGGVDLVTMSASQVTK